MRLLGLSLLTLLILAAGPARPAVAILPFYKVYVSQYIDDHPDQEYATYVKREVKCFVCHQGKKRANHNAFGEHLVELLDKKTDAKDVPKIVAALKKVVDMPVNPDDENSETYGDRIAASKLPGGELEDLKKEPDELAGP